MQLFERLNMLVESRFGQKKKDFIDEFLNYRPISKRTNKPIGVKTVYAYLSGDRDPDPNHYPLIAKVLGVKVGVLFGEKDSSSFFGGTPEVSLVPVVTNIVAGAGAEGLMPDIIHAEKLPVLNKFLNGADPDYMSIIQVAGDSMATTIMPNDWLIIDNVYI